MNKFRFAWMLIVLAACAGGGQTEKKTLNGMKYTVVKSGSGQVPKKGEIMIFDFELRDSKDSVWNSSYKDNFPAGMEVRDTAYTNMQDGITQMLASLRVGDSVRTSMTVPEFFKTLVQRPVPPGIDSTRSLTYSVNVREVKSLDDFMTWRRDAVAARDDKMIQRYIAENKLNAVKDSSGMYIVKYTDAKGDKPTSENCVEVKYLGKFLQNGRAFDGNPRIAFSLTQVITGWRLGFPYLAKGDSATFLIPSALAYGYEGYYGIPPDAVLRFDVTLYDFKSGFDPSTRQCK